VCSAITANQCGNGECKCSGAPACTTGKTCCGNGCADLTSDPKNCGVCGHDCLGGACSAGKCQPFPLASNRTGPLDLALDANNVYWTENTIGGVFKVAKTGAGPITPIKPQDNVNGSVWFIATDGTNVYWTDRTDAFIGYVSVNGGVVGHLANDVASSQPYGIAVGGGFVYWADFGSGGIWRAPAAGNHPSNATQVGTATSPTGIGAMSGQVLWSEYAGFVYRGTNGASTSPGTPLTSTTNGGANVDSRFLATDGTRIYWTMSDGNAVWTVPNAGGTATPISTVEAEPWGIAVDTSGVYWVNKNPNGAMANTIRRAQLVNGAWVVSTIAQNQGGPSSVAVDATAIYWTSFAGNQVMKLAK
jgi:hypothetical protein